ncbi:MAG TPA: hypothetical protein VD859_00315 [Nocardioides sp.]|nr:hypothetical protein [Nocardioides sp.]
MTVVAVQGAEHQGGVPNEVQGNRPADRAVGAQGRDRAGVQVDDAGLPGLGCALDQLLTFPLVLDDTHAAPDGDPPGVEVDVPPAQ